MTIEDFLLLIMVPFIIGLIFGSSVMYFFIKYSIKVYANRIREKIKEDYDYNKTR